MASLVRKKHAMSAVALFTISVAIFATVILVMPKPSQRVF
jgi:hypothetical protein